MDLKFKDIDELYELLLPALEVKEIQLRRNDYLGISKKNIWEYLKETRWKHINKLRLHMMVNDIISSDNEKISSYNEI